MTRIALSQVSLASGARSRENRLSPRRRGQASTVFARLTDTTDETTENEGESLEVSIPAARIFFVPTWLAMVRGRLAIKGVLCLSMWRQRLIMWFHDAFRANFTEY